MMEGYSHALAGAVIVLTGGMVRFWGIERISFTFKKKKALCVDEKLLRNFEFVIRR